MSKRWRRYRATVAVVSFVLLVGFLVGYVQWSVNSTITKTIDRNNQRQCAVLAAFTEPPPSPPAGVAKTPVGVDLQRYNRDLAAQQAHQLALIKGLIRDYNCPEVPRDS